MSSDEDQPIIMDLLVGFNFSDELVIVIDLFDYEEPAYNCPFILIYRYVHLYLLGLLF